MKKINNFFDLTTTPEEIVEYHDIGKDGHLKLHREDGPAIVYSSGIKQWYLNGRLHREDGPAIEYPDGNKSWHFNGVRLDKCKINVLLSLNYPIKTAIKLICAYENNKSKSFV